MSEYPTILAIDFSKACTGLAIGQPPNTPILANKKLGDAYNLTDCSASMITWVPEMLSVYQPDVVILEAALPPIASRDQNSARLALGADFMIKGYCAHARVKCFEVAGSTWKSRLFGTSRLKTHEVKQRSIALCKAFELEPKTHDEADAFCVWLFGVLTYTKFPQNEILKLVATQMHRLVA